MATKPTFNPRVLDRIKYEQGIHTWADLALLLGITRDKLNRWRNGTGAPSFADIAMLAFKFHIPFQDMVLQSEDELLAA